jgi:hypothetical protein
MRAILVTFLAVLMAQPAFGDWYRFYGPDGNKLTVACKAALRVLDAGDGKTARFGSLGPVKKRTTWVIVKG